MATARLPILATAIMMALILSGVPVQLGTAPVETPTLDWFFENKTLEYEITNETNTLVLNATIINKTGSNLTWQYWTRDNGSQQWLNFRYQNTNRSDLNFTDFMTYLWVNSTNVDNVGETVLFGNHSYTLDSVTTEHYVFTNTTLGRTLKYDLDKGWLEVADYEDGVTGSKIGDRDTVNIDPVEHCTTLISQDNKHERRCRGLTTYARGFIEDIGDCEAHYEGEVRAEWPSWHVFDYDWRIFFRTDQENLEWEGTFDATVDGLTNITDRQVEKDEKVTVGFDCKAKVEAPTTNVRPVDAADVFFRLDVT